MPTRRCPASTCCCTRCWRARIVDGGVLARLRSVDGVRAAGREQQRVEQKRDSGRVERVAGDADGDDPDDRSGQRWRQRLIAAGPLHAADETEDDESQERDDSEHALLEVRYEADILDVPRKMVEVVVGEPVIAGPLEASVLDEIATGGIDQGD